MSKIAALMTVLMLTVGGSAFAQDYRSPDAKAPSVSQDYRSPDAQKPIAARTVIVVPSDRRSPDARPSGRFESAPAQVSPQAAGSFAWGYLAAGVGLAALLALGAGLTQRR